MQPLSQFGEFPVGSLILDKAVVLAELGKSVMFVPLEMKLLYQQNLPYGTEGGMVVSTEAEVRANGGTVIWSQEAVSAGNHYGRLAHVVIAVCAPEGMPEDQLDRFPYAIASQHWARVVFSVAKTSWNSFGKPVLSAKMGLCRDGLYNGFWYLDVKKETGKKGTWYSPVPKFGARWDNPTVNRLDYQEFFRSLLPSASI